MAWLEPDAFGRNDPKFNKVQNFRIQSMVQGGTGMSKLQGRTALVTGSGRGIGRAIALKLAVEGANLVINDLDEGPAAETLEMLEGLGAGARAVVGDVADPAFPELMIGAAVEAFGGVDIIVNNAGYIWNTTIQNTTDEQWAAML